MKGFLLTIISIVLVIIVLNLDANQQWFQAKPAQYWTDFLKEKDDTLDEIGIMKVRYGAPYTISMRVKEVVEKKHLAHPIILFEPNSYYRDSLHIAIRAPEPAVFYYYTGLEGVWTNSPDAAKATFLLRISKKGVNLDEIRTPQQLQQILAYYKKFTPTL